MNDQPPRLAEDSEYEAISDWAKEIVTAVIGMGLVPENLRRDFQKEITRAEFCALAVAFYEYEEGEISERTNFTDTDDANVQKAAAIGIVSGVGDGKFSPDGVLTREQAAVMLSRLADALGYPLPKEKPAFSDTETISSWAAESVGAVQAAQIMSGVGDNLFAPKDLYTREQSIFTLAKLFDCIY